MRQFKLFVLMICVNLSACSLINYSKSKPNAGLPKHYISVDQNLRKLSVAQLVQNAKNGNVEAETELGLYYLHSGPNYQGSLGLKYLQSAGNQNSLRAQQHLAKMYQTGSMLPASLDKELYWLTQAAKQGDGQACLQLAKLYQGKAGLKSDENKVVYWYLQAVQFNEAKAKVLLGQFMLSKACRQKHKQAFQTLSQDVDFKDIELQIILAKLYQQGHHTAIDLGQALNYYMMAAKSNHFDAAFSAACLIEEQGQLLQKNTHLAFKLLHQAAKSGMKLAQFKLGEWCSKGIGTEKNLRQAAYWYNLAAQQGVALAQYHLADLIHAGQGHVPRDLAKAVYWYQQAAEQNLPYPQFMLSVMYELGRGVVSNLALSSSYYQSALKSPNYPLAMYQVGRNFMTGQILPKNEQRAVSWLQAAAAKNLASADLYLADYYSQAETAHCDYSQAYALFYDAARQNSSYGEYSLGLMYLEGKGLEPNAEVAFSWFKRAAYHGSRPAQYQLGLMYQAGQGTRMNKYKALAWLQLSTAQMSDITPTIVADLVNELGSAPLPKVLRLIEVYQSKYQAAPFHDVF